MGSSTSIFKYSNLISPFPLILLCTQSKNYGLTVWIDKCFVSGAWPVRACPGAARERWWAIIIVDVWSGAALRAASNQPTPARGFMSISNICHQNYWGLFSQFSFKYDTVPSPGPRVSTTQYIQHFVWINIFTAPIITMLLFKTVNPCSHICIIFSLCCI